jgi:hypothetical protein
MVARQQKETVYFYCTQGDFFDTVFEYMDFGIDYRFVNTRLRRAAPFAKKIAERNTGVHVLRQPMWHAILSILMARHARVPSDMRKRFAKLCSMYSPALSMSSGSGTIYRFRAIPDPHALIGCYEALRDVLRPDIADALSRAAKDYCDGWYSFSEYEMSYRGAQRYLAEFPYWLPDEREKLLAWGFHYGIAYPESDWSRALLRRYGFTTFEWVNKKLLPVSGYEAMASMYFQAAHVKELRKNGTDR